MYFARILSIRFHVSGVINENGRGGEETEASAAAVQRRSMEVKYDVDSIPKISLSRLIEALWLPDEVAANFMI